MESRTIDRGFAPLCSIYGLFHFFSLKKASVVWMQIVFKEDYPVHTHSQTLRSKSKIINFPFQWMLQNIQSFSKLLSKKQEIC